MLTTRFPRIAGMGIALLILATHAHSREDFPLPILNLKSGISISLSGANGQDWAIERTVHNDSIADEILFIKASVKISLVHNKRNSVMMMPAMTHGKLKRVLGVNGTDGKPDTGDEGTIHWKIDRDGQAHLYAGSVPKYAPAYVTPFSFSSLTYDGAKKVLGAIGDNGGPFGASATATDKHFAYGQRDDFGNEWHTLTTWDDDIQVYKKVGLSPHRQGSSDGHFVAVCVNPVTPIIQLKTNNKNSQFYTTPIKTYHIPKIWQQTTFLTSDVLINFVNLTNTKPVMYRIGDTVFKAYKGTPIRAGELIGRDNTAVTLEVKSGREGAVLRRTMILNPDYPGSLEKHGFVLLQDEGTRKELIRKVHEVEPFKASWRVFLGKYFQGGGDKFTNIRGGWRTTAYQAAKSFANALGVTVEGVSKRLDLARLGKKRLLYMFRYKPVGFELYVSNTSPSKDYFNELGQTMQRFMDAAIAYDLLISVFRQSDHPEGVTPIEERIIRDGIAQVTKCLIQFRDNNTTLPGGGSVHWAHGYEFVVGMAALCMPTYKTPYYGVSGGDFKSRNDLKDTSGRYWNPFPDQGITWYDVAANPDVEQSKYPNNSSSFRAEFLISDEGYWTGPNDLAADGDRYHTGPVRTMLVDVNYGGLSNADARVELVEMAGYEGSFVERHYAWHIARKLAGDKDLPPGAELYQRRRLVGGVGHLKWNKADKRWEAMTPDGRYSLCGFNPVNKYAGLPTAKRLSGNVLEGIKNYYNGTDKRPNRDRGVLYSPYVLLLCADPNSIKDVKPGEDGFNIPPIIKPMLKYVVFPGENVYKHVVVMDPNDQKLTVNVEGMPAAAKFDPVTRLITWQTTEKDQGVHLITVTASDGIAQTKRCFPIMVMNMVKRKLIPSAPKAVKAVLGKNGKSVRLSWSKAGDDIFCYFIYRDGSFHGVTKGTNFVDDQFISPNTHTRYNISAVNMSGSESVAATASPAILSHLKE